MFREYNLINSDIILEHHDKYHISNAFDLKYFKDREYGVFYEFGPAISLDIPMDVCYNLVYETDWGHIPYNRNSPERILSHEIAHYSQLLGSSYGYLLYRSRLARKLFFYWVFRRNKELWPNIRIDRPCLKYFKSKLSDRNVDGLFKKLILGYIVRDLIVSWLYDYKGGDACYHVNSLITTIGEALAIDVLSREYINSDDFVFSCMYVIDVSLKQYYSKLINNAEYPSKIISPRSIIECYARSIEHWTLKPAETSKTNLKSTVLQNEHILASQGVYGYAEKYLIDKFVITFHKNKVPHLLLTLFISIYELSLMSRLHPALLGKEILTAVKTNNLKYQELSILDRFYTIINYVSSELINNKQKIIDRLNAVFRDPTTVTSFLDHICDGLGWMPYSVALDKLAVYYKKETDRCKYAPEVYFYKIAQKIVDAKINNKAFAYQTSDFIIDDFIQNKVPLVIFCSDGQVTIGDEFKDMENIFNYFFPQIFAEINNLEIMSTDNYEVSRNLLKYMGNFENGEMESFIRLNPYWDQIN